MRSVRPFPAFPAVQPPSPNASGHGRARRPRLTPLARDIAAILVVKAIVLGVLWFAFFRAPEAPRMAMDPQRVEQKLLAPSPAALPAHALR